MEDSAELRFLLPIPRCEEIHVSSVVQTISQQKLVKSEKERTPDFDFPLL